MTEITVSSAVCVFHVIDCSAVRKKQYCQTYILDGFIVNRFGCIPVPACRCISSLLSRVISFWVYALRVLLDHPLLQEQLTE
jgi:hypothetical protein